MLSPQPGSLEGEHVSSDPLQKHFTPARFLLLGGQAGSAGEQVQCDNVFPCLLLVLRQCLGFGFAPGLWTLRSGGLILGGRRALRHLLRAELCCSGQGHPQPCSGRLGAQPPFGLAAAHEPHPASLAHIQLLLSFLCPWPLVFLGNRM